MFKVCLGFFICFIGLPSFVYSQWKSDQGDGTYKNPILYADYSDPDVIRVGHDYYMVASSFTCQPGIPLLHSRDLVNWTIINHIYSNLPLERYKKPQHGQGSWAPAIRYHNKKFYVYFCTPEDGLFLATAKDPRDKWKLQLVQDVGNWEDPCPFWDSDGKAYLLRGRVGAGPAILHRMSDDGTKLLDNGKLIYRDDNKQPILEGFKFMEKRDGYYYFAAPAGGVSTGWQSVFRSKNIYGPYKDKIVLNQGNTAINGPHQGAFVETPTGQTWFIHFQDKGFYGRIVHMQPVVWKKGWPIPGIDNNNDGIGEPVDSYRKPDVASKHPIQTPQTSDDFSSAHLGLQWQWQSAPEKDWYSLMPEKKVLRLNAVSSPTDDGSLFYAGNLLLQKISSPSQTFTTKLTLSANSDLVNAGLAVVGNYYTSIAVRKSVSGFDLVVSEGKRVERKFQYPQELVKIPLNNPTVWLRTIIREDATCSYLYSLDGRNFTSIGKTYPVEKGMWIGAKVGIYCINGGLTPEGGHADFSFFQVTN
ncbi:glycoside hydrolase family 43 protein [Desertivirga arenae]|uniref:glycoside hydrolase family 43 protein n=1 Tax=Desertivirga arenae TaxID=2810309 RepID=UPI001A95E440|nr:glycoside hydrolase 43 family protein [Pedobacter sp. SYSU D00823]